MPTIKTKREMNLGELLCWAIDNKEQASFKDFYSKNIGVKFNASGYPCIEFEKKFLPTYETFTVQIEEEVTEDTVIPKMLVIYYKNAAHIQTNKNLNFLIKNNLKSVYIMNDDKTMTLIWTKEKGLVE